MVSIFLLLKELAIINPSFKIKKTIKYELIDECSVIAGKLIHVINNEGDCKIHCLATCESRNKNYEKIDYLQKKNNCNICNCYCK